MTRDCLALLLNVRSYNTGTKYDNPDPPVDECVHDAEDEDGQDGGGEERVDDEAVRVPEDVGGVHAQGGSLVLGGAVLEAHLR